MTDPSERGVDGSATRTEGRPPVALDEQARQGQLHTGHDGVPEPIDGTTRPDDRQSRRYAHTLRRNTPLSTPVIQGAVGGPAEPRDSAKIAMPKTASGPVVAAADPRDSAKLAMPKAASSPVATDARESARLLQPKRSEGPATTKLRPDPPVHGSEPIPRPSERSVGLARGSERPLARASSDPALARAGSAPPIARASSEPPITGPISEAEISWPFSEPDGPSPSPSREREPESEPEPAWPVPETDSPTNPASAPSESTAIYRKRNTRPALPVVPPAPSARHEPAAPSIASRAADTASDGEDRSGLPQVMHEAGSPRIPLLPVAPNISALGRLILPTSLVVILALAVWLIGSIL